MFYCVIYKMNAALVSRRDF